MTQQADRPALQFTRMLGDAVCFLAQMSRLWAASGFSCDAGGSRSLLVSVRCPGIVEELSERLVVRRDRGDARVLVRAMLALSADAEGDGRDSVHAVEAQVPGAVLA
jgi:hypothetical protein